MQRKKDDELDKDTLSYRRESDRRVHEARAILRGQAAELDRLCEELDDADARERALRRQLDRLIARLRAAGLPTNGE